MTARLAYALLALITLRWWWPLVMGLCRDAYAAASWPAVARGPRDEDGPGPQPVALASRAAPRHILAFRAAARRAQERQRWEGGFGRRGL